MKKISTIISPATHFTDSIPIPDSGFEIATLSLVAGLLFLSLATFALIILLKLKSRNCRYLQSFNSLWIIRLLLVLLVSLWGFNQILKQPFMRHGDFLNRRESHCRSQLVLDLGILEPGFLISLLFLVDSSSKQNPNGIRSLFSVFLLCTPSISLQIYLVFFPPFKTVLPEFFHGSFILSTDIFGAKSVLCTYPFFSWAIFSVFSGIYAVALLVCCGRVTALAINKGLRRRIQVLAGAVVVSISVQILSLCFSWLWRPEGDSYAWIMLAIFVCVAVCMGVAEVVLVITPVVEALEAADCGLWRFFPGRSQGKIAGDFSTPR
ncbi:hypothetical protein M569_02963 [Genlisea aurea]|uniref:Uncharacterized protein n=1 Tax=Genlisea aurea TaxID=192259 RepID=S8D323_9LAMI|nr:hypothetical protein M569_02963 [Genlisea aurea]